MGRRLLCLVALVTADARLPAQDPGELGRVGCDDADPANRCPGETCRCVDDTLEVTFDGVSQSVLELSDSMPQPGIEMTMVMDVQSERVQGWSYGVEHDDRFLRLQLRTVIGTDAEVSLNGCLCPADWWGEEVETCKDDPDPACPNPRPAKGFVSAVILSFIQPIVLEARRNTLMKAHYQLVGDPGTRGTVLKIVDHLKEPGFPRVPIAITVEGRTRYPRRLVDGIVRREESGFVGFRRGDLDGSGRLNVADAIGLLQAAVGGRPAPIDCDDLLDANDDGRLDVADAVPLLAYLFQRGAPPPEPFLECGFDPTLNDALGCVEGSCL